MRPMLRVSLSQHPRAPACLPCCCCCPQLLYVWNSGAFRGNHVQFHSEILARMPGDQTPNLFPLGPAAEFAKQRPFTI